MSSIAWPAGRLPLGGRLSGGIRARNAAGAVVFGACFTLYLAIGAVLDLGLHLIVPDSLSRVANAFFVLYGRDPHLGAIGFVWSPLPSILEMPLVVLGRIWTPLVTDAFAGAVVSAAAMAAAVLVLRGLLADLGIRPTARALITVLFALHPMIVHYGANGDSEALFLLTLLLTARALNRWLTSGTVEALALGGLALAAAYLTRYETVGAAAGVGAVVAAVSFARAAGGNRERLLTAGADVVVVIVPFAITFAAWSLASWILVGDPFEQFSSVYGVASQLSAQGDVLFGAAIGSAGLVYVAAQVLSLAPALPFLVLVAAIRALWRRDPRVFAALGTVGFVLAFAVVAWLLGQTAGWYRYYISTVPLAWLLAGYILAPPPPPDPISGRERAGAAKPATPEVSFVRLVRSGAGLAGRAIRAAGARLSGRGLGFVLSVVVIGALAVSVPVTVLAMFNPSIGRGENEKNLGRSEWLVANAIDADLDRLNLPSGSVLLDTFYGSPIVLSSGNPAQFVVTSDRDFQVVVDDPAAFHVQYVLVPPPVGLGSLDSVNRLHPGFFENGAGIATLVRQYGTDAVWRLYRLNP